MPPPGHANPGSTATVHNPPDLRPDPADLVHATTTFAVAGATILMLAAITWVLLRRQRTPRPGLGVWCGGLALFAGTLLLWSMRGRVPEIVSVQVSGVVLMGSYVLRVAGIGHLSTRPLRWPVVWVLVGAAAVVFLVASGSEPFVRVQAGRLVVGTAECIFAWVIWRRLVQTERLRGALGIVAGHALFGLAAFALAAEGSHEPFPSGVLPALVAIAMVASAVADAVGYLLIADGQARRLARAQEALVREAASRAAAEEQARSLRQLLQERDDLLQLLAHEVRQPLNNASAALQAAHAALAAPSAPPELVGERLRRGEAVLGQIVGVVDNTLAAAMMLTSGGRAAAADTDIPLLLSLVAGDLQPADRARLRLDADSGPRTAAMDVGLLRLALRNLVHNALAYSPPGSPVLLRVAETDDPLAVVFDVCDAGQGIDETMAERIFERGVRGRRDVPGLGLGLYVVKRVAELHGGAVQVLRNPLGGATVRLSVPQGGG